MAALDLVKVCEEIAKAANAIDGLTCTAYVPDAINEPHFFVAESDIDYDKTFGRDPVVELTCRVFTGRADDEAGQELIRRYLSTGNGQSIKDAIEAARGGPGQRALDGAADDLWVRRQQGYRWYEHNNVTHIGAEILVRVVV
jgi:hypothetical protein